MTTDEGTSNNGENPTAAVLEQGEDITTKKDRGVLKVRHRGAQRGSPALREGEVGGAFAQPFCGGEGCLVFFLTKAK